MPDYVYKDGTVVTQAEANLWGELYREGHKAGTQAGVRGPKLWPYVLGFIREHFPTRARAAGIRLSASPTGAPDGHSVSGNPAAPRSFMEGAAEIAARVYGGSRPLPHARSLSEIDQAAIYAMWNTSKGAAASANSPRADTTPARPATNAPATGANASRTAGVQTSAPTRLDTSAVAEIDAHGARTMSEIDHAGIYATWNAPKKPSAPGGSPQAGSAPAPTQGNQE